MTEAQREQRALQLIADAHEALRLADLREARERGERNLAPDEKSGVGTSATSSEI